VAEGLILETTFLVDLEREAAGDGSGPAHAFLERHPRTHLHVTFTVAGELAAGPAVGDRERWEQLLAPFTVLPWSEDVAWRYGRAFRYLRENGRLIGANDLWIAATALSVELPVVTRNLDEYRRVPGLEVLSYEERGSGGG
jgi:tRNA(fMet)-specific endonuclease VapC